MDLEVKVSEMRESNGRVTWFVSLAKAGDEMPWDWHQVYSDTIEGRARYEAARLEHFLGLSPKPNILAFDTDAPEPQKFTLTCPKCGVDRTQEHCKNPSSCPMIGYAQTEPAPGEKK